MVNSPSLKYGPPIPVQNSSETSSAEQEASRHSEKQQRGSRASKLDYKTVNQMYGDVDGDYMGKVDLAAVLDGTGRAMV